MKFILHSDQSIKLTADLDVNLIRSLTGKKNPKIGYIPAAPDPRRKYFEEKVHYYSKIGFTDVGFLEPTELGSDKDEDFFLRDLIHLSGGQVTAFRDRLLHSGLDLKISDFLKRGGVILGVSAGAMVLQKSFGLVRFLGEKGNFKGLGFLDFEVSPHTNEYFPDLSRLEDYSLKSKCTVYALNDGDAITISGSRNGQKVKMYGNARKIGGAP
ncbi:MAG: Type 1 glutamine amidotransferase-like domain-containing protein [Pseudomonadota bacterium]